MEQVKHKTAAVILAAGVGSRMNMKATKQTLQICGKSVLRRVLEAFDKAECIYSLTVVCKEDEHDFATREVKGILKPVNIISGGKTRAESAKKGFEAIPKCAEYVMIHDAARCLIRGEDIEKVAFDAYKYGAATASYSVSDTIKACDENRTVVKTVPREGLRFVQTPQAFDVKIYKQALMNAASLTNEITDDNMLVEAIGIKVYCTETSKRNIKITTSSDIELAEFIIGKEALI